MPSIGMSNRAARAAFNVEAALLGPPATWLQIIISLAHRVCSCNSLPILWSKISFAFNESNHIDNDQHVEGNSQDDWHG